MHPGESAIVARTKFRIGLPANWNPNVKIVMILKFQAYLESATRTILEGVAKKTGVWNTEFHKNIKSY